MAKITVVMPVYNGEKYLEEAIDSILNQTFTDFKLIVLNDNSSDRTSEILENYQDKDQRVQVITKSQNVGPAVLRNEGIAMADTEYIALMDADDISMPDRFEKQLEAFEKQPDLGLIGSWFTVFGDRQDKVIKHSQTHDALQVHFLNSCGIGNSTVMLKTSELGDLRFDEDFIVAEDYDLWSKFIRKTKFFNIPESLVRYRWHSGNISQTRSKQEKEAEKQIKLRQLKEFGITETGEALMPYLHAITLHRNLETNAVIKAIKASKVLKEKNKNSAYFNQKIFEDHIDKVIVRTIRNAKTIDKGLFSFLKRESGYFDKIPFLDRVTLFFKSLF